MGLYTIDPYYDINFYNQCKEALENNDIHYKEFISTVAPYHFYFEVDQAPNFINFDEANAGYSRFLVNIVEPLKPSDVYIFTRRDSFAGIKGINRYALNDALMGAEESKEGIFFSSTKDEVLRISTKYPRKIYYMGKYFDNRFRVFFTDNLIIQNFLETKQILVARSGIKRAVHLERELNYKVFHEQDRLVKASQTPYVQNGSYYQITTTSKHLLHKLTLI